MLKRITIVSYSCCPFIRPENNRNCFSHFAIHSIRPENNINCFKVMLTFILFDLKKELAQTKKLAKPFM